MMVVLYGVLLRVVVVVLMTGMVFVVLGGVSQKS